MESDQLDPHLVIVPDFSIIEGLRDVEGDDSDYDSDNSKEN